MGKIENSTDAKEPIASFYENVYRSREGKPPIPNMHTYNKGRSKNLDEQTKTEYKPNTIKLAKKRKTTEKQQGNMTRPHTKRNINQHNPRSKEIYIQSMNKPYGMRHFPRMFTVKY
jgi:hypothetical protein